MPFENLGIYYIHLLTECLKRDLNLHIFLLVIFLMLFFPDSKSVFYVMMLCNDSELLRCKASSNMQSYYIPMSLVFFF